MVRLFWFSQVSRCGVRFNHPTRRFSLSGLRAVTWRPFQYRAATSFPAPARGKRVDRSSSTSFLPGPGFDGQDAEPNGITNFNGTFAQVYMGGHAVDSAGRTWDVDVDTRVYRKYSLFPDRREYETSLGGSSPRFRTSSRKGTDWRFFNEFKKELKG